MAAGLDFEIEGLEELERDLTKAIQTAPEKAKETLKGIGKDFKNAAKKRANSELKPHERTGSEKNKAIKRKWGTKVIEENVGANKVVKAGKTPTHTIISNVNDPDAIGAERVAYYGCVIDKMILSDWEAGKTGEESYGFTFQDWEPMQTIN